jgi:NAD(P)-dependent dehydrogenase (short-subunit alcohol dehydrogenase family)
MHDLAGRTAVITGGASGIGLGIAHALGRTGMRLVVADVEVSALERATRDLSARGAQVLPVVTDVADRDAVHALADAAATHYGAVDVLCSNAGVGTFPPVADATGADWDWLLSVNLGGMVNCLLAFLPPMRDRGEGHVVLTASIAGLAPLNMTLYSTTKYAIVGMGESLAQESDAYGYGVGVSILCPGGVATNFSTSARNRPGGGRAASYGTSTGSRSGSARVAGPYEPADPDAVGDDVRRAIERGDLYVLPHPHLAPVVAERAARLAGAFDAARREREI